MSYYYTDHLGSTRAVDVSGEITRLDYAPFGEDFKPTSERYKFTGKEDDISTGLHYFNARYYDPAIGRFITEDSAKDGINWYVYCGNSPLRYVDPDGESLEDVWELFAGFLSGITEYVLRDSPFAREENKAYQKINSTNKDLGRSFGYKTSKTIDTITEDGYYVDLTLSGSHPKVPYLEVAAGFTYLSGNENYEGAKYFHLGGGPSISKYPVGISISTGLVNNVDIPQDFAGNFAYIGANYYIGAEHSRWPLSDAVSSTGITLSTNPGISGRYDRYWLLNYKNLTE
ncbi:MAG: RHS repeat-associated core domain-containing protein [bacterium]